MKTIYKLIITMTVLSATACKTGGDLYISPNDASEATLATLLTAIEVNTFATVEGELSRIGSIIIQHTAGASAQYTDIQNYRITSGDFSNSWPTLYSGTMINIQILINQAGSENPYYSGLGKVLMAMNVAIATDLWGDVPYSEALKLDQNILTPKLDSQEEIYQAIDGLLESAILDFKSSEENNIFIPSSDDLIYSGDISLWEKAAYTLRARYLNRQSNKLSNTSELILDYLSKGISSNSENLEAIHSTDGGAQNQWGAFQNARGGYLVANKAFVDYLVLRNDPRLEYYLSPNTAGLYIGGDITQSQVNSDAAIINSEEENGFFRVERNYPIVTYYESKFIEAEVLQRQGSSSAVVALNTAIAANVDYVTNGIESPGPVANYTTASLENILKEKWVALFCQSIESYNDYRRIGFPVLTPRPESVGAELSYLPKRFPYPTETLLYNPNVTFIDLDVPVWWGE